MKLSQCSEEQVTYSPRLAEAGTPVGDLCCQRIGRVVVGGLSRQRGFGSMSRD